MELKEINKYLNDLSDEVNESSNLDEINLGGDVTSTGIGATKRLTRASGRQYAFKGPGVTRITRKDKRDLLKEKDLNKIMPVLENSFAMMIAAVQGTEIEQFTLARINTLRQQIKKKVEQAQK